MKSSFFKMQITGNEAQIDFYDEIGMFGISAKEFKANLDQLRDVKKITLRLNSPGGDITEGNAMYNDLVALPCEKEIIVTGLAASMATILAMAASPGKLRMYRNSFFMIHNPWTFAGGDSEELRAQAEVLDKMKDNALNAYQSRAKDLSKKDISELLDDTTWLNADEAKDWGFVDEIINEDVVPERMCLKGLTPPKGVHEKLINMTKKVVSPQMKITNPTIGGSSMKKCSCGFENADSSKHCGECGKKFDQALENPINAKEQAEFRMKIEKEAQEKERFRSKNIRMMCSEHMHLVNQEFVDALISDGVSESDAQMKLALEISKTMKHVGPGPTVAVASDEADGRRAQLRAGLMVAMNHGDMVDDKILEGVATKKKFSEVAEQSDVKVDGIHGLIRSAAVSELGMSPAKVMNMGGSDLFELLKNRLGPRMASVGTGDVSSVIADVQNKIVSQYFMLANTTFQDWVAETDVKDFKQIKFPMLSQMPKLKVVPEGQSFKLGKVSDKQETDYLDTYGLELTISRNTIVNDDLGMIDQIGQNLGVSARVGINEAVYDALTSNSLAGPTMGEDGYAMLYASTQHANIVTTTGAPSNTTIAALAKILSIQTAPKSSTDDTGRVLNRPPRFLIAGTNWMYNIFNLVNSPSDPTASINQAVPNFTAGMGIKGITDGYLQTLLTAASYMASYYLVVDKIYSPLIVSYLNGNRTPTIRSRPSDIGEALGIKWQIYWDWCISARDWRGIAMDKTNT